MSKEPDGQEAIDATQTLNIRDNVYLGGGDL